MQIKKSFLLIVGLGLFTFLFLAACASPEEPPQDDTVTAPEDTSNGSVPDTAVSLEDINMYAEQDSYPTGTEQITVILENHSDAEEEIYYGKEFRVEQEVENGWEEVPFEEEMAFIQIAILLPPGEQMEEPIDLTFFEEELAPGTYRVVKQILGQPLYAEFEIE